MLSALNVPLLIPLGVRHWSGRGADGSLRSGGGPTPGTGRDLPGG